MDDSAFAARLAESQGCESSASSRTCLAFEPKPGELARPKRLIEAMRYATLGGGKRLRPFLTIETARALGRTRQWSEARGRGDRMHPCLFADSRRSAGDGRRRLAARAPDHPPRLRRGDGDSRRRRPAGAGVRDPRRSRDRRQCRGARRALPRPRARRWPRGNGGRADARHRRRDSRRRRLRSTRSGACRR